MRYIVLGSHEALPIKEGQRSREITLQKRDWHELLSKRPKTPLVDDLVKSLGDLHIGPFLMEQAKNIIVADGLGNVGKAWKVMDGVLSWLDIRASNRTFEGFTADNGDDVLGVYVKPPGRGAPSPMHTRLLTNAGDNDILAWFGYRAGAKVLTKSVWIYYKNRKVRDSVRRRISSQFAEASNDRDESAYCVVVESASDETRRDDFDWFTAVFKSALK